MRAVVARSARAIGPRRAQPRSPPKQVARGASALAAARASSDRESPEAVAAEMRACYDVVARMGRGAVYLGSARGVGYLILQAEGTFDINTVFAGIVVLTVFALVLDWLVGLMEKRLMRWQPKSGETEKL